MKSFDELAKEGALGFPIARERGGSGKSFVETARAYMELGARGESGGVLLALGAHLFGVALAVERIGNDEQRARWFPSLATGAKIATVAATELESGSDVAKVAAIATRDGDRVRVVGEKRYVTFADRADVFFVLARDEGSRGLTTVLVEKSHGVKIGAPWPVRGLADARLAPVSFDCEVSSDSILGKPGAGMAVFQTAMTFERALILAFRVGAMETELKASIAFARRRTIGGEAIAKHQAVQHRLARMKRRLETSRLVVLAAAGAFDRGERGHAEAALAKWHVAEAAVENALDAFQLRGGEGFLSSSDSIATLTDALGGSLHSGTSDVLATIVAKWLGL